MATVLARHDNLIEGFRVAFDLDEPPDLELAGDGLVAIVLAYNEALRLPHFLRHHRDIGVRHFLVVDNASDDGSAEFLDSQDDVTRFPSSKPYKDFKSQWRHILAGMYLNGRWAYFPDVDELLVYPGWPAHKIDDLLDHWSSQGAEAVFTTMVDMYPEGPLRSFRYQPGQSFLEACPFFDSDGYQLLPLKRKTVRRHPVPASQVFGGPRERLFPRPPRRTRTALDDWLLDRYFGLNQPVSPAREPALFPYLAGRLVQHTFQTRRPKMSKVPLLKWRRDIVFSSGVHSVSTPMKLAPDWCALLHFKYLDDFVARTEEAVERGQHIAGAWHYKHYFEQKDKLWDEGAMYPGSKRFRAVSDLQDAGLVRESDSLQRHLLEALNARDAVESGTPVS